jgi:Amt family ammonium transporter
MLFTVKGAASIVIAIVLGKRKDFHHHHGEVPPSNTPLACIGAALLWMGTLV